MTDVIAASGGRQRTAARLWAMLDDVSDTVPFNPARIQRMRHVTWWALIPMAPAYALLVAWTVQQTYVNGHITLVEVIAYGVILVGLTVEGVRFCRTMMRGMGLGRHMVVEHSVAFAVALATMAYALAESIRGMVWPLMPAVLAGALVVNIPPKARWPVAGLTVALTTAVASGARALGDPETGGVGLATFYTAFLTVFTIFIMVAQAWFWDVVLELDRARAVSGELAVTQERLRFAADLHDIQGHHLQAIALKGELAERLIGVDDDAARAQAAEVAELARTALRDTREVVHGYRRSDLRTELDNAREILTAGGIETTVDGSVHDVPPPLQPLFGALVREGATNVLRHSRATRCALTITVRDDRAEVTMRNDVALGGGGGSGSGLEGLRERFATLGGTIETEHADGDWFTLRGRAGQPVSNEREGTRP